MQRDAAAGIAVTLVARLDLLRGYAAWTPHRQGPSAFAPAQVCKNCEIVLLLPASSTTGQQ